MDPKTNDSLIRIVPNAKTILPLHVLELGHGSDIISSHTMDYQNLLDNYADGYFKSSQGKEKNKFMPLIWGESVML